MFSARICIRHAVPRKRWINTQQQSLGDYESKYAEKLRKITQEKGISIDDLRIRARKEGKEMEIKRAKDIIPKTNSPKQTKHSLKDGKTPASKVRKDNSPVKPLSSILNIPRILETPHTASDISTLWSAYHMSRSNGTGRGYLCASIPISVYEKMIDVARRYPSFVLPLSRLRDVNEQVEGEETAHEFYFMQWGFHDVPPPPFADPFVSHATLSPGAIQNPQTSTLLFTPLQEYKSRNSFATPYLVLTHYTDLAQSHGVVLLRGEITPSTNETDGRYMLRREDAQMLAMGTQKFYLWGQGEGNQSEGERLLKIFHERPEDFQWEELLKYANLAA